MANLSGGNDSSTKADKPLEGVGPFRCGAKIGSAWGPLVATLLIAALLLTALSFYHLRTPQGEVYIELEGGVPDDVARTIRVELVDTSHDEISHVAEAGNNWSLSLAEGNYEARIIGGPTSFRLDKQTIEVVPGRKALLHVLYSPEK